MSGIDLRRYDMRDVIKSFMVILIIFVGFICLLGCYEYLHFLKYDLVDSVVPNGTPEIIKYLLVG